MIAARRAPNRRGFTVVELLIVIAIIGVLMALLLPAVQAGREAARRIACASNLKNLGLALHLYHDDQRTLPPGAVGPITPAFPQYLGLKHHGLGTFLLPYVEQQPLASRYRWDVSWGDPPNQPVVNVQLKIWQCPSAPANRIEDGSLPTVTPPPVGLYSGTAACGDYAGMGTIDAGLPLTGLIDPPAGPRDERGHYEGAFPVNAARSMADLSDGTSHTILIAECAGRPQLWQGHTMISNKWVSGGPWASRNLLFGRGAKPDGTALYGPCAVNCTNNREVYGFHPSGANAVFADGSVHFLSVGTNIRVFAALVTRAGGEVIPAGDY